MTTRAARVKSLLQVAGTPALMLAVFGDFFTPVGGAAVVGVVGIISILLGFQLLFTSGSAAPSLIEKFFGREEKIAWWWEGAPSIKKHAFWVAVIFGLICLVSAKQSFANRESGGYIAQSVPVVSAAQHRLLGEIATNTRETADNTREIAENTREAKRETSDDPRKEIHNTGQAWSETGFLQAIKREDLESIELYLKGGMSIKGTDNFVFSSIYNRTYAHLDLFEKYGTWASYESCRMALFHADIFAMNPMESNSKPIHSVDLKSSSKIDPEASRTYKVLCSKYPDLPSAILTKEACKNPDYVCEPDAPIDHSDLVAVAMASNRQGHAACVIGKERLSAEYGFCKRLLDQLD